MPEGKMEWELGLNTMPFVGKLDAARRSVLGLGSSLLSMPGLGAAVGGVLGSVASVGAVAAGVFAQITRGSGLNDLSKVTGSAVSDLVQIQGGLKGIGRAADEVKPLLMGMNRSLGGFNEMGEPTKDVFAGLGLSVDELKAKRAPEALADILGKLSLLNNAEATLAARKIFAGGMEAALQAAREGDEFTAAMRAAAGEGERMDKVAGAFDRIDKGIEKIKGKTRTLFLGLAEGAAPGLQALVDKLNTIDLSGLGQRIGGVLAGISQSFIEGRFSEVFELSLQSGIQGASNFMLNEIVKWGQKFVDAMSEGVEEANKPGTLKRWGYNAAGVGSGLLGMWNQLGAQLGVPGAAERAKQRFDVSERLFQYTGWKGGILDRAADQLANTGAINANPFADALKKLLEDLAARAAKSLESVPPERALGKLSAAGAAEKKDKADKTDVTSMERLGFILGRGGEGVQNRIERNTRDIVLATREVVKEIKFLRKNPSDMATGEIAFA